MKSWSFTCLFRLLAAGSLLAPAAASAAETLTLNVNTAAPGGGFSPRNVVAIWVEQADGTFIKTLGRWAGTRAGDMVLWVSKAGLNDSDAVMGATRSDHNQRLTMSWDLRGKNGQVVPPGEYVIRMEMSDGYSRLAAFPFSKNGVSSRREVNANGYPRVEIDYVAIGENVAGVQFDATNYSVNEGSGSATATVKISGTVTGQVTVKCTAADDSAKAGTDYTATSTTLTFAPGETTKTCSVPILDDETKESVETLRLTLTNALGAPLGTPVSASITITDDDSTTIPGGNGLCGDGVVNGTDHCDGTDFQGANCQELGFAGGQLRCKDDCDFDTSRCLGKAGDEDAAAPDEPETGGCTAVGGAGLLALGSLAALGLRRRRR